MHSRSSMAALFPKIYDVIQQNPHKHEILRWREPTSTEVLQPELWDSFALRPLDPPGALSLLLFHTEPMYELSSQQLRKQILLENLLTLHERIDKELIGRKYPRKKIQDLLAQEIATKTPGRSKLLEDVLCELFAIQKIHLNRKTKNISFSPSDLRLWTSSKKILIAEDENVWSYQPVKPMSLPAWLRGKEEDGWKIEWPTADGKFEELKTYAVQQNIVLMGKQKKDELATLVGRAQALRCLEEVQLTPSS
jgi:hypothetical protein